MATDLAPRPPAPGCGCGCGRPFRPHPTGGLPKALPPEQLLPQETQAVQQQRGARQAPPAVHAEGRQIPRGGGGRRRGFFGRLFFLCPLSAARPKAEQASRAGAPTGVPRLRDHRPLSRRGR